MKARDFFGLAVRFCGLLLVYRSLPYLSSFLDAKLYPSSEKMHAGAAVHLIYATIDLSVAVFFLLWTRVVVSWSYDVDADGGASGPGRG